MAHPVSSPWSAGLLQTAWRGVGTVHPGQPQRLSSIPQQSFGGKPQRYRKVQADFHGTIADLMAKSVRTDRLGGAVTQEDTEILLAALQGWGGLDRDYRYVKGEDSSDRRGWDKPPGGGLERASGVRPSPSHPPTCCMAGYGGRWRPSVGLRLPDHAVSAGWRHGCDRPRNGARGGTGPAIANEGHGHPAG